MVGREWFSKKLLPGKVTATFALGTKRLYDFIHDNSGVEMMPVNFVNSPINIAQEDKMISINATTEIDFSWPMHQRQFMSILLFHLVGNRPARGAQVF
ncbi:hypothetical protein KHA80_05365 [Anaerobacillus sp. HL2]|nr:hypothetical protein KHA80_05365 [Anaerobacillus sp. HL2]